MSTTDSRSQLPIAFRATRRLKTWNVVATAAAIAALTGTALSAPFAAYAGTCAMSAISTFACALVWASMLRARTFKQTLLASFLLAPLSAALAYVLSLPTQRLFPAPGDDVFSVGATVVVITAGSLIWAPGLLLTWILFGRPLLRAKRLAEEGLGGEDRGERRVALFAGVFGAIALVGFLWSRSSNTPLDRLTVIAMSAIAIVSGAIVAASTVRRERARLQFLRSVKSGERDGYRIERSQAGDLLLRVTVPGDGYRAAPLLEEIAQLDATGDAKRAVP